MFNQRSGAVHVPAQDTLQGLQKLESNLENICLSSVKSEESKQSGSVQIQQNLLPTPLQFIQKPKWD